MVDKEQHIKSFGLTDYGCFRLENLYDLASFAELEQPIFAGLAADPAFEQLRVAVGIEKEAIPLELLLPSRPMIPPGEIWEAMHLSLAELAGASAAIRLFTGRETLFFGATTPGPYQSYILFEADQSILAPPRILAHCTGTSLAEKFGINLYQTKDLVRIQFPSVEMVTQEEIRMSRTGEDLTRVDLHAVIGFCKLLFLYGVTRQATVVGLHLINQPLVPFSQLTGEVSIEKLVSLDRVDL